jgi:hypothetical protein
VKLTFATSRDATDGLILEQGLFAGWRFGLDIRVCESPVCVCNALTLHCFPEINPQLAASPAPSVRLEVDLARRAIKNLAELQTDPAAFALAKAVESEISEREWTQLWTVYVAVKEYVTDEADPDQIHGKFPPDVLEGKGSLAGYCEVLPYAKAIEFALGGDVWFVGDQYCVNPACSCREAFISFFRIRAAGDPDKSVIRASLVVRYAYDNGRIELEHGGDESEFSGREREFINALKNTQPDLKSFVKQRHHFLRRLFINTIAGRDALRHPAPAPRPSERSPGRNDPCPCGSGKKFKKCYGS